MSNLSPWARFLATIAALGGNIAASFNGSKRQAAQEIDVASKVTTGLNTVADVEDAAHDLDAEIAAQKAATAAAQRAAQKLNPPQP